MAETVSNERPTRAELTAALEFAVGVSMPADVRNSAGMIEARDVLRREQLWAASERRLEAA